MNNFKIDDKVVLFYQSTKRDELLRIGIVTDSYDDCCMVKWEPFDWEKSNKFTKSIKYLANELISYEECLSKQQKLEDEYRAVADAVSVDVVKAAEYLKNAISTAKQSNINVAAIYEIQKLLFPVLDECGWHSS